MTSDEIAKNLLLEKTCDNCNFLMCEVDENTCEKWKPMLKKDNVVYGELVPQYTSNPYKESK